MSGIERPSDLEILDQQELEDVLDAVGRLRHRLISKIGRSDPYTLEVDNFWWYTKRTLDQLQIISSDSEQQLPLPLAVP